MTLGSWVRDYLYIPMGGNRGGEFEKMRNLFLSMLLVGLWHGAGWHFVFWGGDTRPTSHDQPSMETAEDSVAQNHKLGADVFVCDRMLGVFSCGEFTRCIGSAVSNDGYTKCCIAFRL